ncbi:MAG: threonine synthase, partial [Acidobacteriota bacterium]|nr:threonine synthase [Acidobacteriota bacterium]
GDLANLLTDMFIYGFNELKRAMVIAKIPALIGVQSANCAPLYHAYKENLQEVPTIKGEKTLAEGIAIASPIRGKQILDAVRNSKGHFITVSEEELKEALLEMCGKGYYIEPTSASTIAGIKKYLRQCDHRNEELIVSVFTGIGLKTQGPF